MIYIERFAGVIAAVFLGLGIAFAIDLFLIEEPICKPTITAPTC